MPTLFRRAGARRADLTGPSSAYGMLDAERDARMQLLDDAPRVLSSCISDRCRQGDVPCPTPGACRYIAQTLQPTVDELRRYSTGQPIAGEDVADTSSPLPWLTLPRFWQGYAALIFAGLLAWLNWPRIAALLPF